jgi:hypothetical protein
MTMKAVTVKLPDALKARLEAEAGRRGTTLSCVVREAAETYVTSAPVAGKKQSAYDLSKDLCGCLNTGIRDLASNPKYLEDLGLDSMGDSRHRPVRGVPRAKRGRTSVGR